LGPVDVVVVAVAVVVSIVAVVVAVIVAVVVLCVAQTGCFLLSCFAERIWSLGVGRLPFLLLLLLMM
jgi:hypothetical protein